MPAIKRAKGDKKMTYIAFGKVFEVKETNGKYFYFSKLAARWLPVSKSKVTFLGAVGNA